MVNDDERGVFLVDGEFDGDKRGIVGIYDPNDCLDIGELKLVDALFCGVMKESAIFRRSLCRKNELSCSD